MRFDRAAAKQAARASMRVNKPNSMVVTLVYLLLTGVLSSLVMFFIYNPAAAIQEYMLWGYDPEEVMDFVFLEHAGDLALAAVAQVILGIYGIFMNFGYVSYALRLARNEQPSYGNLFDGFARPGRVFWAAFLVGLFTSLWVILVSIPMTFLLTAISAVPMGTLGYMGFGILIVFGYLALVIWITMRYRLTYYFMLDDPDCTAREAIRQSKQAMKGWKWEAFVLDLSFLGWALLTALLTGILLAALPGPLVAAAELMMFWYMPYTQATYANFYDHVTGAKAPSGDSAGPVYGGPVNGTDERPF